MIRSPRKHTSCLALVTAFALSLYGLSPVAISSALADEGQDSTALATESASTEAAEITAPHVDDEVVVTYEDGTVAVQEISDDTTVEEAISDYSERSDVASAQPNFIYQTLDNNSGDASNSSESDGDSDDGGDSSSVLPNDERLSSQYYLFGTDDQPEAGNRGANLASAWSELSSDAGTSTVAVIDSGVDLTHPDLQDNLLSSLAYDATQNKLVSEVVTSESEPSDYDVEGHGTHVAGIIAASSNNEVGIASAGNNKVKVLSVRAFDEYDTCKTEYLVSALQYVLDCVNDGTVSNLHVLNMSLGYYAKASATNQDVAVRALINQLLDAGVVTVCAGGNGYNDVATTDRMYPADFDECISVEALSTKGTELSSSDYNSHKDISAPGESIISTHTKKGRYKECTGSSQAAPLVSATLGLMWAQDSSLSTKDAVYAATSTAAEVSGQHKESASAGALDAQAALAVVKAGVSAPENTLDLGSAKVEVVMPEAGVELSKNGKAFLYDGGAFEPDVRVTVDGKVVNGSEYTVSYENNVEPGTATVTVSANGMTASAQFEIVDESGSAGGNSDQGADQGGTSDGSGKDQGESGDGGQDASGDGGQGGSSSDGQDGSSDDSGSSGSDADDSGSGDQGGSSDEPSDSTDHDGSSEETPDADADDSTLEDYGSVDEFAEKDGASGLDDTTGDSLDDGNAITTLDSPNESGSALTTTGDELPIIPFAIAAVLAAAAFVLVRHPKRK